MWDQTRRCRIALSSRYLEGAVPSSFHLTPNRRMSSRRKGAEPRGPRPPSQSSTNIPFRSSPSFSHNQNIMKKEKSSFFLSIPYHYHSIIVALVAAGVYANTLNADFVYDDR